MSDETTMQELQAFKTADLSASAQICAGKMTVRLDGSADMRVTKELDDLLRALDSEARQRTVPEVIVDFRTLQFMNSSCLKSFVSWLMRLQALSLREQYRIRFLANPAKNWQRRSLSSLSCFAADLVEVEF